ncbi:MAG: hypothetical protein J3Q66DRAFT_337766 [Benniella sp.]|nr:MAG: hypothetical protein J3Q66DRAFT_337766 [Benniella sp.]
MTIPWDIEHRFRSLIKQAAEVVICTLEFGATTSLIPALASPLVTLSIRVLRQYQQTLENKDLLNIAGIDYHDTISGQRIESFYQLEAMRVLFPNLPWRLGMADTLTRDQFNDLTMMTNGKPIILNNSSSVATFTNALSRLSRVDTIPITIESAYFQERSSGSQGRSNTDMMNKLGLALRDRKELKHLSIHITAVDGHGILEDRIFAGLRAVLGSRSLETLRISGMPSFLEDEHIKISCQRLRDLDLVDVNVNTFLAVKNINKVHKCAKDARIMSSHSSPSTPSAI